MLQSTKNVLGFGVLTVEQRVAGSVEDFLVDPRSWFVRFTVVETGSRRALVNPAVLDQPDGFENVVPASLTSTQFAATPTLRPDGAISVSSDLLGVKHPPVTSVRAMLGSRVEGKGGKAGRVSDLVLDTETWQLSFLVVEQGWLLKKEALVRTSRVRSTDPVVLDVPAEEIRAAAR